MKTVLVILLVALLAGCSSLNTAQTYAATYGAAIMDDARESAEWTLCHGISVGAWRRAYAADPVRADAWRNLCSQPAAVPGLPTETPAP